MLRSLSFMAAISTAAWPTLVQARSVPLVCHDETYVCYTDDADSTLCRWTPGDDYDIVVEVVADPRYPNSASPQHVYNGEQTEHVGGALANLDITVMESPDGTVSYHNILRLSIGSIMAETSGVTYLRNALRIRDSGTGFSCTVKGR